MPSRAHVLALPRFGAADAAGMRVIVIHSISARDKKRLFIFITHFLVSLHRHMIMRFGFTVHEISMIFLFSFQPNARLKAAGGLLAALARRVLED